ncbi:hypothetical protein ABZ816_18280 [Actinosynnema sp. NPDC047251]|uniref:Putative secreted protein n=1 Tax=Saccharothrix espanaensis (strain ATCC 51144 / DSM 44229 / JCM 9112 / NBRC 15066 / NRRL 15764) TaxID=1179773 RepID=K0K9T1_SACES|nr:hypothetical protein [Saccharothrix espanaensis]CCH33393.1 putative secreted protein [Saccharothrix espanaensis DSM 44229]
MKRNRRKRRLLIFCFVFALVPLTAQRCTGEVPCGTGTAALALFLPLALPGWLARAARFALARTAVEADPPCDAGSP